MSGGATAPRRDRTRLVPILGWIRTYDRRWLRGDLIAGVAVAALIVPKNLGYAGIAGIPLQNGLYAAAAGAILYAVFGTSRQISTGPSSGLAAVAASAVLAAKITGEQDAATFVAGITLASGVLFVLLAVFKMGWIAQFLSTSRRHGLPLRCRDRRRDRRAPQTHRDRDFRIELAPGAVVVAGNGRGRASADGARRRRLARGGLRTEADRATRPRSARPGRRRTRGLSTVRPRSSRCGIGGHRAERAAVVRDPGCAVALGPRRDDRDRCGGARHDRVLSDGG